MREITVEESKHIMMDILIDVTNYCDTHGLEYFLTYGTLLGAVRHKGFIPWDDDIDIAMPRQDYERFVQMYHHDGKFAICAPLVDSNCFLVYSKVYDERTIKIEAGIDYDRFSPLGIDVDIFPLDGMPPRKNLSFCMESKLRYEFGRILARSVAPSHGTATYKSSFVKSIVNYFCRLIGKDFIIKTYIDIATKYKYSESDFVHVAYTSKSSIQKKHRKELFLKRIQIPFEGHYFWAPWGYDEYLSDLYHNYMSLPPIEQQTAPHTNNIFWKE